MEPVPRFAVLVPCFDDGETLPDALASLEGQQPHELVVIDDGSTDDATLRVLAELEGRGVRVIRQQNAGLSAARMAGVEATAAPYVLPLDADDVLAPGSLAPLADALDRDRGAAVAWGDVEIFGDFELELAVADGLDAWSITYLNTLPGTSMIRRDALLAVGGWQLRHGYEDWDLWMAFAERGWRGVHVPGPWLRYRRRSERMLAGTMARHGEIYADLRRRHPELFARRRREWLRSRSPLGARAFFPLIGALPLSDFDRLRLYQLVYRPRQFAAMRRLRRRAERLQAAAP